MLIQTSNINLNCLQTVKGSPYKRIKFDLQTLLVIFSKEFKFRQPVELSLTLCGKDKIKTLNKKYRSKDKSTDVLSFPVHNNYKILPNPVELGDIFICLPQAKSQARNFNITLREEILHLFVHGFLHLLGFDHEISRLEEKKMFNLEKKLLIKLGKIHE